MGPEQPYNIDRDVLWQNFEYTHTHTFTGASTNADCRDPLNNADLTTSPSPTSISGLAILNLQGLQYLARIFFREANSANTN